MNCAFKFFKLVAKKEKDNLDECVSILSDPKGPLLQLIPSPTIVAANKDVAKVLEWEDGTEESTSSQGKYLVKMFRDYTGYTTSPSQKYVTCNRYHSRHLADNHTISFNSNSI